MISQLANLNWISVLISFAIYFVIGALWFTVFFPKTYKISLGKADETLPSSPIFIVGPALCSLVIVVSTAILMYALPIQSLAGALELAIVIGVGFLVANTMNIAINPNIPKPILYGMISSSYHLVGITFVCAVLYWLK